nr:hypothetical protein [Tanacetum cinerariifolium]
MTWGSQMKLKTSSSFKTTGLLQCKIFSKCLTTRVTGWDQPPLQRMQMMYCFINNIHVDYVELLWEGIHYSFHHSTSLIPYLRFTMIIIGHYMTNFPEISRRARDKYHILKGVFGIDVPLTQSQPTESNQRTYRTPSALRSPNPKVDAAESSAPKRSTLIRLRIPQRRSTCLAPPNPVTTIDKADKMILQDTLQISLAEHKSKEEQEARENVALVDEHLAFVEIEKMVEGQENVIDDSSIPRNDEHNIPGTREKWKIVEESRITPFPIPIRSPRIHTDLISDTKKLQELTELQGRYGYLFEHLRARFIPRKSFVTLADHLHDAMAESLPTMVDKHVKEQVQKLVLEQVRDQVPAQISLQIQQAIASDILSQLDASVRSYMSGHILNVHPAQLQTASVPEQQYQLYLSMKDDPQLQQQDDNPHDDAHLEGENSAKRQKTFEYEAYVSGESLSGLDNEQE